DIDVRLELDHAVHAGSKEATFLRPYLRTRGAPPGKVLRPCERFPDIGCPCRNIHAMSITPASVPHGRPFNHPARLRSALCCLTATVRQRVWRSQLDRRG